MFVKETAAASARKVLATQGIKAGEQQRGKGPSHSGYRVDVIFSEAFRVDLPAQLPGTDVLRLNHPSCGVLVRRLPHNGLETLQAVMRPAPASIKLNEPNRTERECPLT